MNRSVSPHMVALLVLTSLTILQTESSANPTSSISSNRSETSSIRSVTPAAASSSGSKLLAASKSSAPIPRAIPVATAAPKAKPVAHLEVRREPVSFHPITVKNGPQPYVIDPDSLQKGLALISELYRKSGNR